MPGRVPQWDNLRNGRAKTLGIGLPGFRKLKDFLGNDLCHAIARILEPRLLARHPVSCAHGAYDFKPKAIDRQTLIVGHGTPIIVGSASQR
jgi:hypothetical protein